MLETAAAKHAGQTISPERGGSASQNFRVCPNLYYLALSPALFCEARGESSLH